MRSMASKAAEISRKQRQDTCWWDMAEANLLYREARRYRLTTAWKNQTG